MLEGTLFHEFGREAPRGSLGDIVQFDFEITVLTLCTVFSG